MLALVIFDGYELFPAMREELQSELKECYHPQGTREFDRRSVEGLVKSLNHCHRVNQLLIRDNDRKDRILDRQWLWIKILGGTLGGSWVVLAGLIVLLMERV